MDWILGCESFCCFDISLDDDFRCKLQHKLENGYMCIFLNFLIQPLLLKYFRSAQNDESVGREHHPVLLTGSPSTVYRADWLGLASVSGPEADHTQ